MRIIEKTNSPQRHRDTEKSIYVLKNQSDFIKHEVLAMSASQLTPPDDTTGFSTPPPSPLPEASGMGRGTHWILWFNHQNPIISIFIHLSRQRVTLPQSIGEGPGMGLNWTQNTMTKPVVS